MLLSYPWVAELYNHGESGFEGVAADLEGVFFVCEEWTKFHFFLSKFSLFGKFECEFWRNHKELSFDMLTAIIGPALVSRAHTECFFDFFPFSDDGDAGLKARIRRGNGQEGHKLAYQTWVAFFWGFCLMQSSLRLGIRLIRWIKWLPGRCTRSRLWVHGFLKSKVMPKFSYSKNIRVQFFITGDKPRYFRI